MNASGYFFTNFFHFIKFQISMIHNIENSWQQVMAAEFNEPYFKRLIENVQLAYSKSTCFPPINEIFNAFNLCPFNELKVVIIGQDPYHGLKQANGLAFSVYDGVKHPPSLRNIIKEIESDFSITYERSGDLSFLAQQGVLLLNTILTVEAHQPKSHEKFGWEQFTDSVIKTISEKSNQIVFILWGNHAKKKAKFIDTNKHHVLSTGHPSPLSANKGLWFGNKHFSKTNEFLKSIGKEPIKWY